MAKKRKAAAGVATARGSSGDRQVARLEQRLARLVKDEAKRSRQLDEVRARQAELRAQIADLGAGGGPGVKAATEVGAPAPDGPRAYCMREKRKVTIAGAERVVLGNGRHAYAGSCPDCGARVIAIVAAGTAG